MASTRRSTVRSCCPGDLATGNEAGDDDDDDNGSDDDDDQSHGTNAHRHAARCHTRRDTLCAAAIDIVVPFNDAFLGVTVRIPHDAHVVNQTVRVLTTTDTTGFESAPGCTLELPGIVCRPRERAHDGGVVIVQESAVVPENATTAAANSCFVFAVLTAANSTGYTAVNLTSLADDVATRLAQLAFCDAFDSQTVPINTPADDVGHTARSTPRSARRRRAPR